MKQILKKILLAGLLPLNLLQSGITAAETVVIRPRGTGGYLNRLFRGIFWKKFKSWWRKIGRIHPKPKRRGGLFLSAPYAMAITSEQYSTFSKDLKSYMRALKISGLPSMEAKLLRYMLEERLKNLRSGPRSMFTRMMPSPGTIEKEKSLQRLEKNIDLLIRLRGENRISSREFRKALNRVQGDILRISVYRTVAETYGRFWYLSSRLDSRYKQLDLVSRQLKLIEDHFQRYKDRAEKNPKIYSRKMEQKLRKRYDKARMELNRVRRVLPNLLALIDNLEK